MDESGANLAMARNYGRIANGQRLHCPTPYHRGSKYSIISAISTEKIVASLYCENSIDGEIFSSFIENRLVSVLQTRHKVIMDNVAFHKVKEAEELIKATGAQLIFLPPCSSDLSPIELMWSKIKCVLRKFAARTAENFQRALSAAFHSVNSNDLLGWFEHGGYRIR
ncbi:MAG: transposase [Gammaproteobacteria bacterium]